MIEKFLKMRDPNPLIKVTLIHAVIKDDFNLKDIKRKPTSAEAFTVKANVRQRKKPAA